MPEIIRYKVRQTREVEVTANNAVDAAMIGTAALEGKTSILPEDFRRRAYARPESAKEIGLVVEVLK